jgi:hypothetical protein
MNPKHKTMEEEEDTLGLIRRALRVAADEIQNQIPDAGVPGLVRIMQGDSCDEADTLRWLSKEQEHSKTLYRISRILLYSLMIYRTSVQIGTWNDTAKDAIHAIAFVCMQAAPDPNLRVASLCKSIDLFGDGDFFGTVFSALGIFHSKGTPSRNARISQDAMNTPVLLLLESKVFDRFLPMLRLEKDFGIDVSRILDYISFVGEKHEKLIMSSSKVVTLPILREATNSICKGDEVSHVSATVEDSRENSRIAFYDEDDDDLYIPRQVSPPPSKRAKIGN